jgi:hypothetical protein
MAGKRWSKIVAGLMVAAVLSLTAAAGSGAEGEPDTGAFNAFNLRGSDGYRMIVWAASGKGYRDGQVLILVGRRTESVGYFAPAEVTDTRVTADLGAFGEIDVTFQPSGERGVEHPVCDRSQRVTYDKGSYVGTIDLHGEEGYTQVHETSVPLTLHPFIDFICGSSGSGESRGHGLPGARLRAGVKFGEGEAVEMQANQNRPGAQVRVSISTKEKRDRVHIFRQAAFTYPASSFDFSSSLSAASFSPSTPFSGAARFLRHARPSNRWTGNLAVDLPGRSGVSLTGSRFDAGLAHARYIERRSRGRIGRLNLLSWPSTKPSPTVFATPSPLARR